MPSPRWAAPWRLRWGCLTALRFLQGLGGAAVMVLPRAVIRDIHTGPTATRLMAMIMLVVSISPMLAPMVGSGLIAVADWRVIFGVLAAVAFGGMALSIFALPETLPSSRRVPFHIRSLLRDSRRLLTHRNFLGLTLIGAFGMASFFVFIAGASLVYAQEFGLTPVQFSLAFAVNAIGFFISSQFAGALGERFGERHLIGWAVSGFAAFAVTLLALTLAGVGSLPVIIIALFLANACLGLVIPTTMMMALDEQGKVAGLASSLNGTLQMLAGGVMITAASPFFNGKATAMVAAIALCAVIACALTGWLLLGSRSR
ncbi:MAG: MFS transporter [Rhodanobacter sp.]